eukprot:TRINITY_DN1743_c0_g1_i1.p1 TRINITY_DN1743_c0_g1~~TRINITY_DN1743_c0_g1_i1.p1  ORF type:complete len:203 (-),score=44.05 TRINITY_DN1743_c0_g1_i1:161-769(-)
MLKRTLYNILVFPIKPLLRAVEKKKQEDKEQLSQCLKRSLELHALMEKQMVEIFRQKLQEEDEVSKELEKQKKEMDEKKAKMFELSNKALLSEIEADNVTDARGTVELRITNSQNDVPSPQLSFSEIFEANMLPAELEYKRMSKQIDIDRKYQKKIKDLLEEVEAKAEESRYAPEMDKDPKFQRFKVEQALCRERELKPGTE